MVELSSVVSVFSSLIRTDTGRAIRGVFGIAPKVGVHFTGLLTPVRLLSIPVGQRFKAGEIVIDADGIRYLAGNWTANTMLGHKVCENFILFEVHEYVPWTRAVTVEEPISGGSRVVSNTLLGTIGVLREPQALQLDAIGIQVERYRYLMGQKPQLGDFLEDKEVKLIDFVNGLYYVQAQ